MKKIGIDIGSTTIKYVVIDESDHIIHKVYGRHYSLVFPKTGEILTTLTEQFPDDCFQLCITGSAGMGVAEKLKVPFVQEVFASSLTIKSLAPTTDVAIELGGEDAKILFLSGNSEIRMNGNCAGGTGAFIDQMAMLLDTDPEAVSDLAAKHGQVYEIASRCGVFAKSDIQQLLNQGAAKEDIAASILYAVVHQTIGGLAHGRTISGNVIYLGGPLTFIPELRNSFDDVLGLHGVCAKNSLYFAAIGAVLAAKKDITAEELYTGDQLKRMIEQLVLLAAAHSGVKHLPALFASAEEYDAFSERHTRNSGHIHNVKYQNESYYLGIDAGSTTVKAVVINGANDILYQKYLTNNGEPVALVREMLLEIYGQFPSIQIASASVTGYGEGLIQNAFCIDFGIVETVAHYKAAEVFNPKVDFIIDIGGQDMKCFKIRNGAIESILLNEACSSGCGSFLETFARALGYSIHDFVALGLFAARPADLGSRCTVFMNSAVKQAQKDGADIGDISAGLAVSVIKNAVYKVLRVSGVEELGENIVVQGGTFLNDAVLRAFELELGHNVIRPSIAGLMGAFGAALFAKEKCTHALSTISAKEELLHFRHEVRALSCEGCLNRCHLTVNTFNGGRRYIGGNRCDRPTNDMREEQYNLYDYKRKRLEKYMVTEKSENRKTIGIPLGLNMYELIPFWYTLLYELGFNVAVSPFSVKQTYTKGQRTIPSDTACYPAKLMHGHIHTLLEDHVDAIFYPCMEYNIDEGKSDACFNCPVVAFYPEVIEKNIILPAGIPLLSDTLDLNHRSKLEQKLYYMMKRHFARMDKKVISQALTAAYAEYAEYMSDIRKAAQTYLRYAKEKHLPVIVLAGRPYHVDPEVSHGLDKLIAGMGAVVISEVSFTGSSRQPDTKILNQWTYHSRLFEAAHFVADSPKAERINLVQLVSFSCGVDAITSDEVRRILEEKGKAYTQIKIDEINNLGAAKIRLRSLFATMET